MKIRVLRNLGRGLPDYCEGETRDVDDNEGGSLVKRGLAICLDAPPVVKAVAPKPEIAEAKAASVPEKVAGDLKSYRDRQTKQTNTNQEK